MKAFDSRLERLRAAVAGSSISAVARSIGVERCTLSLIVSGKYPASPVRVLERFEAVVDGVRCPHLGQVLTQAECRSIAARPRPSNPLGLQQFRACQRCALREGS